MVVRLVGDEEGLVSGRGLGQNRPPQHRSNLNNVKIRNLPKWHPFTTLGPFLSIYSYWGIGLGSLRTAIRGPPSPHERLYLRVHLRVFFYGQSGDPNPGNHEHCDWLICLLAEITLVCDRTGR